MNKVDVLQSPMALYRAGGDEDVWGRKLEVITVDASQVHEYLADGWYSHPYDVPDDDDREVGDTNSIYPSHAVGENISIDDAFVPIEQFDQLKAENAELRAKVDWYENNQHPAQSTQNTNREASVAGGSLYQEQGSMSNIKDEGELELANQQAIQEDAKQEAGDSEAVKATALDRIARDAIAAANTADGDKTIEDKRLDAIGDAAGTPINDDGMKDALDKAAKYEGSTNADLRELIAAAGKTYKQRDGRDELIAILESK